MYQTNILFKKFSHFMLFSNKILLKYTTVNFSETRADLLAKSLPKKKPINGVKQILLIASGKGGVGKSTVAVNLSVALKEMEPEKEVGLLDADVFGPSVHIMMNLHDTPLITNDNYMMPLTNYGIKCMSMGNLITEKSATMWRGLMVMNALNKLIRQVAWGPLDYMIIDTPPGTGDTHLSLIQNIPITGAVIISTGQKVSVQVAKRGITMFEKLQIPVVGLIQNMSSIQCEYCSKKNDIFGNYIKEFSDSIGVEILERIPIDSCISEGSDDGKPIVISHPHSPQAHIFRNIASKILKFLQTANKS